MVASIPLTTAAPRTPLATTPPESFLARSIEDLSPIKITTADQSSTLWRVAAAASFVAFTALAVAVFVQVALFAPAFIPCAGLTALVLAGPVSANVKNFLESAENAHKEADRYRTIQKHYENLSSKTPLQIQAELVSRGITWFTIPGFNFSKPEEVSRLNPLLAQAKYLDEKIQKWLEVKDLSNTKAKKLISANFEENRNEICDHQTTALSAEEIAMRFKIQAAFVNAILRKGDYKGRFKDIATPTKINSYERAVGNTLGNFPEVNRFLTFKNPNLAPLTFNDVKNLSVAELGQRIFAAMR